jgi:hypothetical protein
MQRLDAALDDLSERAAAVLKLDMLPPTPSLQRLMGSPQPRGVGARQPPTERRPLSPAAAELAASFSNESFAAWYSSTYGADGPASGGAASAGVPLTVAATPPMSTAVPEGRSVRSATRAITGLLSQAQGHIDAVGAAPPGGYNSRAHAPLSTQQPQPQLQRGGSDAWPGPSRSSSGGIDADEPAGLDAETASFITVAQRAWPASDTQLDSAGPRFP